jgi:predicted DNA-binding protein (MmcQ/YjbR family)
MRRPGMTSSSREAAAAVRAFALGLPGAYEDFPWGDRVAKVSKKIFAFLGADDRLDEGFGIGVKLPISGEDALRLPFARPEGYGLGKSGWVAVHFGADEEVPTELLFDWIEESYRAVAPKRLVAQLDKPATSPAESEPSAS